MTVAITRTGISVRAHWNERFRHIPLPPNTSEETAKVVAAIAEKLVSEARREKLEALAEQRQQAVKELEEIAPDIQRHADQLPTLYPPDYAY